MRTSVFCWLGIQSVCSPVPRHEKRAGDILGHGLLQPPWNWGWWGRRGGCFRPLAFGGWRGGGLVWGPQHTRRDTCRPLQAWSFVGQLCMCSKWALPARRHWGAHFMVSPLTAVAHSPLLECAPRARWQAMQWAQLQLRSACYVVISVMCQRTACFSCAPKSLAGRACVTRVLGAL